MPLYKYEISQVEKKEGVCRVKEIEKIFQARAFFAVVTQHQREGEQHHPLGNRAAVDHFAAKLADAEQNVYHGQQLGFFPQKIQGDARAIKAGPYSFSARFGTIPVSKSPFSCRVKGRMLGSRK